VRGAAWGKPERQSDGGTPMRRIVALALALALVGLVAVTTTAGAQGSDRPGVTAKEIKIGGVAGKTNPVGQPYASGFDGAKAYFDFINAKGGIFDRKFKMVAELDDQTRLSQHIAAIRSLVEEEKVFAVLPVVSQEFSGAKYLDENGVPAFGWNIDAEWCSTAEEVQALNEAEAGGSPSPNGCPRKGLFGEKGSYLCFSCPQISPPFVAQQIGATKVGVMSYTDPSSAECAKGQLAAYEQYGIDVVFSDTSLAFGFQNLGDDVQKIKDAGVEFISTCMDIAGEVNISRALRRAGLDDIKFYAPQGYDQGTMKKYGDELNGFFFGVDFVPFENKNLPKGTKQFLSQMKKSGGEVNEQSLAGWQNARLLYEGIKLSGPDFTRESVIDAINGITDWTADGIRATIDWTTDGHGSGTESCVAYIEAVDGKFVPRFGKPGQPFVCFPINPAPSDFDDPVYKPEKAGTTTSSSTP
jgi:branched-chain amino acid transport system substrate-binding protein